MKTPLRLASSLAVLLAPSVGLAGQYPVDVDLRMNDLNIEVRASAGVPLVVTFVSHEKVDATCKAAITSGLDTPQDATVTVKAGKSATATLKLASSPNRVKLQASCVPKK